MTRNLRHLSDTQFDVLVVGAGIYGATIAWEAAARGLSVALIDRGDFGGATSFNSLKTVHGGLRSLQRADLREMRQFIRERRALLRIVPHLVEPLRFVIPTYARLGRSRAVMRLVLAVNDLVARDRNDGLDPARCLGSSRVINRRETLALFPGLDSDRVTGGATWYEGQMYSTERVLFAFVQSAVAKGAAAANYVAATGFLREGARVGGVSAQDEATGAQFDIRARVTVNAAGGWAPALTRSVLPSSVPARVLVSKAVNLVTRLPAPACAIGEAADGHFLFCVPWHGVAIFGTLHGAHVESADQLRVRQSEVSSFLQLLNRAFPGVNARLDDVTLVHQGLLPVNASGGAESLAKESTIRNHRRDGMPGLVTVVGVRYTTARHTACEVVDRLAGVLGRRLENSQTDRTPLAGGDIPDVTTFLTDARQSPSPLSAIPLERLARTYGTAYRRILALIEQDPSLARPLGESSPVTRGELLYATRHEMALHLSDALLRRTDAGATACPGRDTLESAADIMASEHKWDPPRRRAEIEAVEARYRIPE